MGSSGKSRDKERLSADYLSILYKRHFQGALVRSGASAAMWLLALGAFFAGLIDEGHIAGVSIALVYLVLINVPILLVLKRISSRRVYRYFSFLVNLLEIVGYTSVIYFLGGMEAVYLVPIYAALITYIGVVSPRRIPFVAAGMCSAAFALMVYLEYSGVIPDQRVAVDSVLPPLHLVSRVSAVTALLFIVAYISYYTSALLRRNKEKLRKQNLELEERAKRIEEAEGELRKARQELEQRVEQRTQELVRANAGLRREIRERLIAEQDLKESESKYRYMFENVSDFLCFHDMEGRLIEINRAFKSAYGLGEGDYGGMNIKDILVEEFSERFDEYLQRIKEKGTDEGVIKVETRDGRKLAIEYKSSLVYDSKGMPVGVHSSGRDVTERIKMVEEKENLLAQVMRAQRLEAIGTLAGGVAHNFNNLLMGIQGNATIAGLKADRDSPVKKKLENIESLVKRGAELTNQLLGYAREVNYEERAVDLNTLVVETADAFNTARKDIVIHQDLTPELMRVNVDQSQMEQVMFNLYVNAAEAMEEGGEIFLETRNTTHKERGLRDHDADPGNYVCIKVRDTGKGMDENTRERAFEPFFTSKGLTRGTGLGLASAYGIVKAHGGEIVVHSKEGKGSTFEIYLPAHMEEEAMEQITPEAPKEGFVRGKGTVLFVDDEEIILDAGQEMLEDLGYTVLTARSGEEALALYEREKGGIDVVVLDMVMPGLGGGEVYKRLQEVNQDVKVLLSSGYRVEEGAEELLKQGCRGFIQKPFDIAELARQLDQVISSP